MILTNDLLFIKTLSSFKIKYTGCINMVKPASSDVAKQLIVEFIKRKKEVEQVNVSTIEQKDGLWIISGTCPINLEGHLWVEKFEVIINEKGKITSSAFALL